MCEWVSGCERECERDRASDYDDSQCRIGAIRTSKFGGYFGTTRGRRSGENTVKITVF